MTVATRLHASSQAPPEVGHLPGFCRRALEYTDQVLVATDHVCNPAARQALAHLRPRVKVMLVSPWKGFSQPLNALLQAAESPQILFQSLEVSVSAEDVARMRTLLQPDVLVVGGRMTRDHGGPPGVHPLSGETAPWNTLALWDTELLRLTGFLAISDGLPESPGGAEEVAVISLLQQMRPQLQAILTDLPSLSWDTEWTEDSRLEHHRWKMPTKRARAEAQLQRLGIPRGRVHVM